jgi:hypothetical protein
MFSLCLFEGGLTAPLPKGQHLFAFLALQFGSNAEERAQQHSRIIIGEFDEPGFLDEPAKFDPLCGPGPSLDLPFAPAGACLGRDHPQRAREGAQPARWDAGARR